MPLSETDVKIQRAITTVNSGDPHQVQMCSYLQAMRGRVDTYLSKNQSAINPPVLIHFIEETEVVLNRGERQRTVEFYFFSTIEKLDNNPEKIRVVHDKLDSMIHEFFVNLQVEGLRPAYVGTKRRLIEQVAAMYDAGILFQLNIILDARC